MTAERGVSRENFINPWLKRLSRASAWALLAGVVVLVVSGWGITQSGVIYHITFGLVDRRLADAIHRATNVPLAVFFLVHVLTNIKLALSRRRRATDWLTSGFLIAIGLVILGLVIYMEYFRLGG
jgi:cytochrome b subunit of formate dehydrogenase